MPAFAEDAIAQWLDECCACDPVYADKSGALFASWKTWADAAGEYAGSQKRFSQALEDRDWQTRTAAEQLLGNTTVE